MHFVDPSDQIIDPLFMYSFFSFTKEITNFNLNCVFLACFKQKRENELSPLDMCILGQET